MKRALNSFCVVMERVTLHRFSTCRTTLSEVYYDLGDGESSKHVGSIQLPSIGGGWEGWYRKIMNPGSRQYIASEAVGHYRTRKGAIIGVVRRYLRDQLTVDK